VLLLYEPVGKRKGTSCSVVMIAFRGVVIIAVHNVVKILLDRVVKIVS
jgi:hypothetical protein